MSILPEPKTPWPPAAVANTYLRMPLRMAWLGGDPAHLSGAYGVSAGQVVGGAPTTINPQGGARRVVNAIKSAFWANQPDGEVSTKRHLPVAQDIATISSELLFSDPPQIQVKGPLDENGEPTLDTKAAQIALDKALDKIGFQSTLLAAAEISSALGFTGLRIAWDKTNPATAQRPTIVRQDGNACIPIYSWGQLRGVIFWQIVQQDADTVWRHLEAHEGGRVWHALYKGDHQNIGELMPLETQTATANLAPLMAANPEGLVLDADPDAKTATSIPNMLPDPLDPLSYAGRSDFTPAVIDLFDSIDMTYSQMMDAIDDGKSRLMVAASLLESRGPGRGASFDLNQRVFTKLNMPPGERDGAAMPIEKVQFEMRIAEYLQGIHELRDLAIQAAGYNSQSLGTDDGGPITATQYAGEGKRSMSTRDKKIRYWDTELEGLLSTYLRILVNEFHVTAEVPGEDGAPAQLVTVKAFPVEVTFPEAVQPTLSELAATAKALADAKAASTYVLVATVHPDWSPTQVQTEVDRIVGESTPVDPVTFGAAGQGVGPGDSQLAPIQPTAPDQQPQE